MTLPVVCSFWHGELGWLERLCIASFVEKGHRFDLYAYEDLGPVPAGCTVREADSIIPRSEMFFYKGNRSPAVFADLFRLRLMEREAGIWADCDVYCVRPFEGLGEYVYGIEAVSKGGIRRQPRVNNAVFRCPSTSDLLQALLRTFVSPQLPPGLPWYRELEVRLRRLLGEDLPVQNMQFGATGPWPLNYHLHRLDLFELAQPKAVFYPMNYGEALRLSKPGATLAEWTKPETLGAHFWHSALTERGSGRLVQPEPGSFFAQEAARLGVL